MSSSVVKCLPAIISTCKVPRATSLRRPESVIPPAGNAILTASSSLSGVSGPISSTPAPSISGRAPIYFFPNSVATVGSSDLDSEDLKPVLLDRAVEDGEVRTEPLGDVGPLRVEPEHDAVAARDDVHVEAAHVGRIQNEAELVLARVDLAAHLLEHVLEARRARGGSRGQRRRGGGGDQRLRS